MCLIFNLSWDLSTSLKLKSKQDKIYKQMITLFHYYNFGDLRKILQTYSFTFIYTCKTLNPSLSPSFGLGVKVTIVWNVHYLKMLA